MTNFPGLSGTSTYWAERSREWLRNKTNYKLVIAWICRLYCYKKVLRAVISPETSEIVREQRMVRLLSPLDNSFSEKLTNLNKRLEEILGKDLR